MYKRGLKVKIALVILGMFFISGVFAQIDFNPSTPVDGVTVFDPLLTVNISLGPITNIDTYVVLANEYGKFIAGIEYYNRSSWERILAENITFKNNILWDTVKPGTNQPIVKIYGDVWTTGNNVTRYQYHGADNIYYRNTSNGYLPLQWIDRGIQDYTVTYDLNRWMEGVREKNSIVSASPDTLLRINEDPSLPEDYPSSYFPSATSEANILNAGASWDTTVEPWITWFPDSCASEGSTQSCVVDDYDRPHNGIRTCTGGKWSKCDASADYTELEVCAGASLSPRKCWFIDPINGNDATGDGSMAKPWKSLSTVLTVDGIGPTKISILNDYDKKTIVLRGGIFDVCSAGNTQWCVAGLSADESAGQFRGNLLIRNYPNENPHIRAPMKNNFNESNLTDPTVYNTNPLVAFDVGHYRNNGARNITIDGIEISGGASYTLKFEAGAKNVILRNSKIHGAGSDVIKVAGPGVTYGGYTTQRDNVIENCEIYNSSRATYATWGNSTGTWMWEITSLPQHHPDEGIDVMGSGWLIVRNNFIHDAAGNCAYSKGGSRYNLYEDNFCYNTGIASDYQSGDAWCGIYLGEDTMPGYLWPPPELFENIGSTARNNILVNCNGNAFRTHGGKDISFVGNTLYNKNRNHSLGWTTNMGSALTVIFGNAQESQYHLPSLEMNGVNEYASGKRTNIGTAEDPTYIWYPQDVDVVLNWDGVNKTGIARFAGPLTTDESVFINHTANNDWYSDVLMTPGTHYYYAWVRENNGTYHQTPTRTITYVPAPCDLTNAYWSTDKTFDGRTVTLTIEGGNCSGDEVEFEVFEDDLFGGDDSPINQPDISVFYGDTAQTTWVAEYQPDGFNGINDPPEYYFTVKVVSNPTETIQSSDPLLNVYPPPISPVISNLGCNINGNWESCNNLAYGDVLQAIRADCTDADGTAVLMNFSIYNLEDAKFIFEGTATQSGDTWEYSNSFTLSDSGVMKLTAYCEDDSTAEDIDEVTWLVPWGYLGGAIKKPVSGVEEPKHSFFDVTSSLVCYGGECGNISVILDPILGNDTFHTTGYTWPTFHNNEKMATRFQMQDYKGIPETISAAIYDVRSEPECDFYGAIYEDNSGTPGNKLMETLPGWIVTSDINVTLAFDPQSVQYLRQGEYYWLAFGRNNCPTNYDNWYYFDGQPAQTAVAPGLPTDSNIFEGPIVYYPQEKMIYVNYQLIDYTTKGIIPMNSGIPFYTTTQNPNYCENMKAGSICDITWHVNTTGDIGDTFEFFAIYDPLEYSAVAHNESSKINITIGEESTGPPSFGYESCADAQANDVDFGGRTCREVTSCVTLLDANSYYLLINDLNSPGSCLTFRGANSVLDLNQHMITYGDVGYDGVSDYDFEIGTPGNPSVPLGWDFSSAPHAQRVADDLIWISNRYLVKFNGVTSPETIVSNWIDISYIGSSYTGHAILYNGSVQGIHSCDVGLSSGTLLEVESESSGIVCSTSLGQYCSFTPASSGRYRLRITVNPTTYNGGVCYIDFVDIRPGAAYSGAKGIEVTGSVAGTKKIMNGYLNEAGHGGFFGIGIKNSDSLINLTVEGIHSEARGLETNNFYAGSPGNNIIRNNTFINENTYSVNRHVLYGPLYFQRSSYNKIYNNSFFGGQGGIFFDCSNTTPCKYNEIYDNYFSNNVSITNHYSIASWHGENFKIHDNIFEQKSPAILLTGQYLHHFGNNSIYNNLFNLTAMSCNAEYPYRYTTSAIRITDYMNGVAFNENNTIFNNTMYGHAPIDPEFPSCVPTIVGWHSSYRGQNNRYENNSMYLTSDGPGSEAIVVFTTSSPEGYHKGNTYASDFWINWIGDDYGSGMTCTGSLFDSNTFLRLGSDSRFNTTVMGNGGSSPGYQLNHTFLNNTYLGGTYKTDVYPNAVAGGTYEYALKWYLEVHVSEGTTPLQGIQVNIQSLSQPSNLVINTDSDGLAKISLNESYSSCSNTYNCRNNPLLLQTTYYTPYNVSVTYNGETKSQVVDLDSSKSITFDFGSQPQSSYGSCAELPLAIRDQGGITRQCVNINSCGGSYGGVGFYYLLTQNISFDQSCLTFGGTDNILDLNGYKITFGNAAGTGQSGIYLNSCTNCKITNGWIEQGVGGGTSVIAVLAPGTLINPEFSFLKISYYGDDGAGIMAGLGDDLHAQNFSIHDNVFNMSLSYVANRMVIHAAIGANSDNGKGGKIYNNVIFGSGHGGINVYAHPDSLGNAEFVEIFNNTIGFEGIATNPIAMAIGSGANNPADRCRNVLIHDNFINMSNGRGMYTGGDDGGDYGVMNVIVYNNHIETSQRNLEESPIAFAVRIRYGGYNISYINNTIITSRFAPGDFNPETFGITEGPPQGGKIRLINNTIAAYDYVPEATGWDSIARALKYQGPEPGYINQGDTYFEGNTFIGDEYVVTIGGGEGGGPAPVNGLFVNNTFVRGPHPVSQGIIPPSTFWLGAGGTGTGGPINNITFINNKYENGAGTFFVDNNMLGGSFFYNWTVSVKARSTSGISLSGVNITFQDQSGKVISQLTDLNGYVTKDLGGFYYYSPSGAVLLYPVSPYTITASYPGQPTQTKSMVYVNKTLTGADEVVFVFDTGVGHSPDVNSDGRVNIKDLAIVIYNQGRDALDSRYEHLDINGDGEINLGDVQLIIDAI